MLALLLIITLGKAVPIAILARLDGQRPGSALRAGALIGQSGEFSFVLASTGLALGAVRPDSFSLAMGAVVLSILTAGPLLAAGAASATPSRRGSSCRRCPATSRRGACAVTR